MSNFLKNIKALVRTHDPREAKKAQAELDIIEQLLSRIEGSYYDDDPDETCGMASHEAIVKLEELDKVEHSQRVSSQQILTMYRSSDVEPEHIKTSTCMLPPKPVPEIDNEEKTDRYTVNHRDFTFVSIDNVKKTNKP